MSTVVRLDDFPDNLGFIKDGIKQIFDKIYIKDFQANISPRGESGFYGLSIVSKQRLHFQIPGTEMFLILNPDSTDSTISSFPVTVEYQWLVLSYLRSFNLQSFSYSARDFFELGLQILNVSEEEVISLIINNFVTPKSDNLTKVEQFVNDFNTFLLLLDTPTLFINSNSSFIKEATSQPRYLFSASLSHRCLFVFGILAFILLGDLLF